MMQGQHEYSGWCLIRLQGQADRVNYLMTKQAKIVAMTCTHAALKRREFLQLGFKFDNLLMEESAQILEIETFIPMLLQVDLIIRSLISDDKGGAHPRSSPVCQCSPSCSVSLCIVGFAACMHASQCMCAELIGMVILNGGVCCLDMCWDHADGEGNMVALTQCGLACGA